VHYYTFCMLQTISMPLSCCVVYGSSDVQVNIAHSSVEIKCRYWQ